MPENMAVVVITDEIVPASCIDPTTERVLLVGKSLAGVNSVRLVQFSDKKVKKAREGGYIESDKFLDGKSLFFPREVEFLWEEKQGRIKLRGYKSFYFSGDYFDDQPNGRYDSLISEIRRYTRERYSLPEEKAVFDFLCLLHRGSGLFRGSCRGGFDPHDDAGWSIQRKFGLEKFINSGEYGTPYPKEILSGRLDFREKYPDLERLKEWSLKKYASLIYDILKIKYESRI